MARMIVRRSALGPLLTSFLFIAALPRGAAAAPTTAAQHEQSRADFVAGNEAFRAGNYETARARYQAALQSERAFDVLCNLGRTEAVLGDDALALRHLDECLKEYPPGDEVAAARGKFFALRDEVRARCKEHHCDAPSSEPAAGPRPEEAQPTPAEPSKSPPPAEAAAAGSSSSARLPVSLTIGAVGLAGVGLGVGFFVASANSTSAGQELASTLPDDPSYCSQNPTNADCSELNDLAAAARDQHTIATVATISGGALVGAALLTYLLWPSGGTASATTGNSRTATHTDAPRSAALGLESWAPIIAISPDGQSGRFGLRGSF